MFFNLRKFDYFLKIYIVFAIGIQLGLITSCSKSDFINDEDYLDYLKSSKEINKVIGKNELKVTISYRPTEYVIIKTIGKRHRTKKEIDSLSNKFSKYLYFILSISDRDREFLDQNLEGYEVYSQRLNLLAFNFNDVINIRTDKGEDVEIESFQLLRTFGISSNTEVIFCTSSFENQSVSNLNIVINNLDERLNGQVIEFKLNELIKIKKYSKIYESI